MITVSVTTRGDRELALRFETFPAAAHEKLRERIQALTEQLEGEVQTAAPVKTGRLRSEITGRVFGDDPNRIAGYVSVRAAGGSPANEYAKAATLEYGTNKARRIFERRARMERLMGRSRRRIIAAMTKPVHIGAFRYLRGPFEAMEPEIAAALAEAVAESEALGSAS